MTTTDPKHREHCERDLWAGDCPCQHRTRLARAARVLDQEHAGWNDGLADAAAGVYAPRSDHPAYLVRYDAAQNSTGGRP